MTKVTFITGNLAIKEGRFLQVTAKPVYIQEIYPTKELPRSPVNQNTFNLISTVVQTPAVADDTEKLLTEIYNQMQQETQENKLTTDNTKESYETNSNYFSTASDIVQKKKSPVNNSPQNYDNLSAFQFHETSKFPEIDRLYKQLNLDPPKSVETVRSDSFNFFETHPSTNDLKSSESSDFKNQGFRLADFRREFKRSVNDLNNNMSRSINALDFLGKQMSLATTGSSDGKIGLSSSSSSSDCRVNKTLDENLLRKNKMFTAEPVVQQKIQVVHTNMTDLPIKDPSDYELSTSLSSDSNMELRVPKSK